MPVYSFEAMDGAGKVVRQDIEAASREDALSQIKGMGYFPTKLKEKGSAQGQSKTAQPRAAALAPDTVEKKKGFQILRGVSSKELTNFTVQLATLQDAGLPIVRSLRILEGQMRAGALKNIVFEVAEDVEGGSSLSEALAKHPKTFDRLYVNMVKAGEAGGVLDTILTRLADFMEKSLKLKRRVIGALIYPAVVLSVAAIIVAGIMIFVIPSFQKMFRELGIALPGMTEFLLGVADLVRNFWYLIPGIPVAFYVIIKLASQSSGGKGFIDKIKLKLPVMGPVIKKAVIARFSRTLGTLIASGVPILEALTIVKEAAGNRVIEDAIDKVHGSIKEGETIAGPLSQSRVFDDIFVNMVDVGEETGALDKMLAKIADNYEEEVDVAVESMTSLLEPVLIVGLGCAVGFIVISLFMPLIRIIETLG